MDNALAKMDFHKLREMRGRTTDPQQQRELARLEHEAFAREYTQDQPLNALRLIGAVPGYQLAKLMGMGSRTGTSDPWGQMAAGYRGMWQGLTK